MIMLIRLTGLGYRLGWSEDYYRLPAQKEFVATENACFNRAIPGKVNREPNLALHPQEPAAGAELLRRPEVSYRQLLALENREIPDLPPDMIQELENQVKYAGYITKQEAAVKRTSRLQDRIIPENFNYERAINLSTEARQKLSNIRPRTVGQASRISGVNPADITMLLLYLEKPELLKEIG